MRGSRVRRVSSAMTIGSLDGTRATGCVRVAASFLGIGDRFSTAWRARTASDSLPALRHQSSWSDHYISMRALARQERPQILPIRGESSDT